MKRSYKIFLALVVVFGLYSPYALCVNDDPPPLPPIPLDGGVSALIVAGVAYGVKKYRDYRINKRDADVS